MIPDEFDAFFDSFRVSAFRMECRQTYAVDEEDASLRAFREGLPRLERSVRTDPWLRRIATTTVAGRSWSRLRPIKHPLSEYVRWEMIAYLESVAVGEEIRLVDLNQYPGLSGLGPDFWLFDAGEPGEFAIVIHYPPDGSQPTYERTTDVTWCRDQRDAALSRSVSLAEYLAAQGGMTDPTQASVALARDLKHLREAALTESAFTQVESWSDLFADASQLQDAVRVDEATARALLSYTRTVIPGLLQTAGYAEHVLRLTNYTGGMDEVAALAARWRRQEALTDHTRRFEFVIAEAVLRWAPGGRATCWPPN